MAKLPKFTLGYHEKKDKWVLEQDKTNTTVKTFETKADATAAACFRRRSVKTAGPSRSKRSAASIKRSARILVKLIQRSHQGKRFRWYWIAQAGFAKGMQPVSSQQPEYLEG